MAQQDVFGLYRRNIYVDPFSAQSVTQSIEGGADGGFILGKSFFIVKISQRLLYLQETEHILWNQEAPFSLKLPPTLFPHPAWTGNMLKPGKSQVEYFLKPKMNRSEKIVKSKIYMVLFFSLFECQACPDLFLASVLSMDPVFSLASAWPMDLGPPLGLVVYLVDPWIHGLCSG